jgi:pimeloyl-ACP methyl ester carboxylesterase
MLARVAVACLLAPLAATTPRAQTPELSSDPAQLLVFIRGTAVGSVESAIRKTAEGWVVTGSSRLAPPLDVTARRVLVRYTDDWKPLELSVDGTAKGGGFSVHTTFNGTTAENDVVQQGQPTHKVDTVSTDTVVLPNLFFPAYEALAVRIASMKADTGQLRAYVAPQAEIAVDVQRLDVQSIETTHGTVRAHRYSVTFQNPGGPLATEVWTDDGGRLLKFETPSQSLVVIREDIGSVTARRQNISREGDERVSIAANGFKLAATVSRPAGKGDAKGRFPAILLIAGSGPNDRDETVAGIPVFGQLAGSLADAGYLVLRYDKRGIGQSGGRAETADIFDFAEDATAAIAYLRDRKDVLDDRISIFGHSEGALVALVVGSKQKDVEALVLAGCPSGTGADLILEQQKYLLDTMNLTDVEKESRIALQKRIQAAVLGKADWTGVDPELRKQADTEWFHTFLAFSPASVIPKVRQPLLIVQGELDKQVLPYHADKLAELARARKKMPADSVEVVKLPGVNHLLVPADTGDVSEYSKLAGRSISPDVAKAVIDFLGKQKRK